MGKRYKKGNHGKKRSNSHTQYMHREKQINKLINEFGTILKELDENNEQQYIYANRLRFKIKELLGVQSPVVYKESRKRRYVYNDQVMNFKGIYVTWKKRTFHLFLKVKYDIPLSCIPQISYFYKNIKTGGEPNFNIFY